MTFEKQGEDQPSESELRLQRIAKKLPIRQCITALNAQGAGTIGICEKCLLAKAIPNPEFCIPTSIERVRFSPLDKPNR